MNRAIVRHTIRIAAPLVALLLAACEEEQVLTTTRNLDRPGPVAMVCAGRVGDAGVTVGLAPSSCTSDGGAGTLYGFVANTSRGEVAVFKATTSGEPLLDLDPGSPGYGFVPVGSLPTDLKATRDGCRIVTANSGSCDLSVVDVVGVMKVAAHEITAPHGSVVSRVMPRTKSGRLLRARPHEIVLVPASMPDKGQGLCPQQGSYRAYVTFPRCNFVGEIDLNTGTVLRGVVIGRHGFYPTDEPRCPAECTVRSQPPLAVDGSLPDAPPVKGDSAPPADAGVPDAAVDDAAPGPDGPPPTDAAAPDAPGDVGAVDTQQPQPDAPGDGGPADQGAEEAGQPVGAGDVLPQGLDVTPDGDRIYVSSANAGFISVIEIDPESGAFAKARRINLSDGVSTERVKLSPSRVVVGGGRTLTPLVGSFLYAIARDRSVRVISTELEQECETNLDLARLVDGGVNGPGELAKIQVPLTKARCFVVGGAQTPPRRVTEKRTGLRFGSRVPLDVVFITSLTALDGGVPEAGPPAAPLYGVFALVVVSDGTVYVVDVEDWNVIDTKTGAVPALSLPHRFRNELQGTDDGRPDASVVATTNEGAGGVPVIVQGTGEVDPAAEGSGIEIRAPGEGMASELKLVYEDLMVARWSGNLRLTTDGLVLSDRGADFCKAGVLGRETEGGRQLVHGDIVVLVGCKKDDECGLGQKCIKPVTGQSDYGLCFDEDREDELFAKCKNFLRGARELVVHQAKQDVLTLDALAVEPQRVFKDKACDPSKGNADCPDGFYCAIKALNDLGIEQGECFRTGCTNSADCGGDRTCVQPLDGGPRVCAPIPLPIETAGKCKIDADCDPAGKGGYQLYIPCSSERDCNPAGQPALAECVRASAQSTGKTCLPSGMKCINLPGLKGVCARRSPCFGELLRYDVVAGRSFLVGGYSRVIADPATQQCRADDGESPLLARRVPVGLPVYPAIPGPRCNPAGVTPRATPQPNPCFDRVDEGYYGYTDPGTTEPPLDDPGPATVVRFGNPDVWFSLGVSHLAHKTATASPDAGPGAPATYSNMPERGMTIELDVRSGYSRMRTGTSSTLSLPVHAVEGPDGFVYIVDMGDRSGALGTNGQVVRFTRSGIALDTDFLVK